MRPTTATGWPQWFGFVVRVLVMTRFAKAAQLAAMRAARSASKDVTITVRPTVKRQSCSYGTSAGASITVDASG